MLYLLISNNKYMKVGYTSDEFSLRNRMMSYINCNPDIVLIGTIEGDMNKEKQFYRMENYVPIKYTREFAPIHKDVLRRFINDETFVERNIDDVLNFSKSSLVDKICELKKKGNSIIYLLKDGYKNCDYRNMIYENRDFIYRQLCFETGKIYLRSYISSRMRDTYDSIGIKVKPKITDLFIVKPTSKRDGNRILGAFKVLERKY